MERIRTEARTALNITDCIDLTFSSVQWLSRVQLFATPWTAARQGSLSITSSQSLLKFMSIASVMPSNHLILCPPSVLPFSCLQSFPASASFPMSQFFASGPQSIGASASASVLFFIRAYFYLHFYLFIYAGS